MRPGIERDSVAGRIPGARRKKADRHHGATTVGVVTDVQNIIGQVAVGAVAPREDRVARGAFGVNPGFKSEVRRGEVRVGRHQDKLVCSVKGQAGLSVKRLSG